MLHRRELICVVALPCLQFDAIMTLPSPQVRAGGDQAGLQLMVANIDYDSFKGKMGIGRLRSGKLKKVGRSVGPPLRCSPMLGCLGSSSLTGWAVSCCCRVRAWV